jgi:hypothetical protein
MSREIITRSYVVGDIATATDLSVKFGIHGFSNFTVTVATTATQTIAYSISTSPVDKNYMYNQITATSVVGTATGAVGANTFQLNNNGFCKLVFSGVTATGGYSAGWATIFLSYTEV